MIATKVFPVPVAIKTIDPYSLLWGDSLENHCSLIRSAMASWYYLGSRISSSSSYLCAFFPESCGVSNLLAMLDWRSIVVSYWKIAIGSGGFGGACLCPLPSRPSTKSCTITVPLSACGGPCDCPSIAGWRCASGSGWAPILSNNENQFTFSKFWEAIQFWISQIKWFLSTYGPRIESSLSLLTDIWK